MRISDWSSDVCSSDLLRLARQPKDKAKELARNITIEQVRQMIRRLHLSLSLGEWRVIVVDAVDDLETDGANALLKTLEEPPAQTLFLHVDRKSVVEGKSVSVRVALGGARLIKKKN